MTPRREWLSFLAFAGPGLVLFGAFTWWPILYSAYISLTDWRLPSREYQFVGMFHYRALLGDDAFWRVAFNTLVYAVSVACLAQVFAFLLGALLSRRMPGRAIWRALAFTPYVTMPVVAALVWVMLLDPRLGPLSRLYGWLGMDGPNWLSSSLLALGAIIVVGIWKETAFGTVFYVAGRQNLPPEPYEAARLDGAGRWQLLRNVTLPLMTPVIFFLLVSSLIASAKVFDTVALMTAGGPVYPDSSTFVYHLYTLGFREYRLGVASAFAVLFVGALSIITLVQFRFGRLWVEKDS